MSARDQHVITADTLSLTHTQNRHALTHIRPEVEHHWLLHWHMHTHSLSHTNTHSSVLDVGSANDLLHLSDTPEHLLVFPSNRTTLKKGEEGVGNSGWDNVQTNTAKLIFGDVPGSCLEGSVSVGKRWEEGDCVGQVVAGPLEDNGEGFDLLTNGG